MPSRWSAAALAATEGCGGGGSAGRSYYQNAKGAETHMIKSLSTDRIKDGHKVNLNIAKLQEFWKTPQIQTIHIPKSITDASFLRHPDLTTGQKRYLRSIARIHNSSSLRMLVKRQYMLAFHRGIPNPGVLALGGRLSSSPRQPSPCTAWRHQQERGDPLSAAAVAALAAPDMILNSLWRPGRSKDGLKTGYASKTRCKSLKIFRRPGRLFMLPVSSDDAEPHTREEVKEDDVLNKCMQSMSIEEQGEHLMAT